MVIGGGFAGMEESRISKMRGHNVTLYEETNELVGHVTAGSKPDVKLDDRRLLDWYKNEMKVLDVKLVMNTKVIERMIDALMPDAVVIATGSNEVMLNEVPGINKDKVSNATDVLDGIKIAGKNVIMVGGGLVGCETALWLAQLNLSHI